MSPWQEREQRELQAKLKTETFSKDGALYWSSVSRPVPMDVFKDAGVTPPAAQKKAVDDYNDAFIADYKRRMANHVHSDEELFEMRAAFGPGETVVNIFTGKKTRL
jgi:hypothetical protein